MKQFVGCKAKLTAQNGEDRMIRKDGRTDGKSDEKKRLLVGTRLKITLITEPFSLQ